MEWSLLPRGLTLVAMGHFPHQDRSGELFFQYSHYWYGDKVQLRSGQVPLEGQVPFFV